MTLKYTWKRKDWIIKYFGIAKTLLESSVSAKEIKNLLKNCGFSIKGIYKNYNYDEYLSGDTAVVVAKMLQKRSNIFFRVVL
ncbi:MAG TPA: hypothetical protein VKN74_06730 [Candidatus Mcinerneyibacterium sp.]|nr:hypothetical protein [Candidatus Mcinerneyibacterium sp.]